jgi:hypothetical protein
MPSEAGYPANFGILGVIWNDGVGGLGYGGTRLDKDVW